MRYGFALLAVVSTCSILPASSGVGSLASGLGQLRGMQV